LFRIGITTPRRFKKLREEGEGGRR